MALAQSRGEIHDRGFWPQTSGTRHEGCCQVRLKGKVGCIFIPVLWDRWSQIHRPGFCVLADDRVRTYPARTKTPTIRTARMRAARI